MASLRRISAIRTPALRALATSVLLEYRRAGSAAHNENLKHVLRMMRLLRGNADELKALGCDPEVLELSILISDLGKEQHCIEKYLPQYENSPFRAFMDHARISMREGNRLRCEAGVSNHVWRQILRSILGHDGPSIDGSWWKRHYENELKRSYPRLRSLDGLLHCYLDRLDQGGLFPGRSGKLNGGLRKISYDIQGKGAKKEPLAKVIREVFGQTRQSTGEQLHHLDTVEKAQFLKGDELPPFLLVHREEFDRSGEYLKCVEFLEGDLNQVRIRISSQETVKVTSLDEFWQELSRVAPSCRNSAVPTSRGVA